MAEFWQLPKELRNSKEMRKHQLLTRLKDHEDSFERANRIVNYHKSKIIELKAKIDKLEFE